MNLLVTGGAGFIGSNLAIAHVSPGHRLPALTPSAPGVGAVGA